MWTRRAPRYWVDWWAVNPRPDGREPRWGPENENVEEMLEQVADGSAYRIVPGVDDRVLRPPRPGVGADPGTSTRCELPGAGALVMPHRWWRRSWRSVWCLVAAP